MNGPRRRFVGGFATGFLLAAVRSAAADPPPAAGPDAKWEDEMLAFEALDRERDYPEDAVLFTGSSSIRLWKTLEEDMRPYPVIHRGFGGATMTDVVRLADRYIRPHRFRAVVVFVANDISGNRSTDRSPEQVRDLYEAFVGKIRSYDADAPILIVAITPTASRWRAWPRIREANRLIAGLCDSRPGVVFVPTEDLFIGLSGHPIPGLFQDDRLHLSPMGYAAWTRRIRSVLDPILGEALPVATSR